jgi:GWxTD domain-containing protein
MRTTHLAAIAVASLLTVTAFAGGLSKYRNWDKSPQGYLMTAAERTEWASVKNDDDADKFVKDFLAKRKPEFVTQVGTAAANADKYFTVGKVKGSTTERGRLVIILGPPGTISLVEKAVKGDMRLNVDSAMTIGSGGTGASVTDMANAANGASSSSGVLHIYTITYPADKLPAAYGKAITVEIEVDGGGGDRIADRKTQAELDRLYEMAAGAKLAAPAK